MYRTDILANVLELAILGLLMDREQHGYEIRTHLRDRLGLSGNASFGSIYPAISRLEREGLIVASSSGEPRLAAFSTGSLSGERASVRGAKPTGAIGRRGRKAYRITELGRAQFAERLNDPSTLDDARSFTLRMALFRFVTPSVRVLLLEHRRTSLQQRLRELETNARNQELDGYARSVMEHAAKAVQLDLAWIDEVLVQERTSNDSVSPSYQNQIVHETK